MKRKDTVGTITHFKLIKSIRHIYKLVRNITIKIKVITNTPV